MKFLRQKYISPFFSFAFGILLICIIVFACTNQILPSYRRHEHFKSTSNKWTTDKNALLLESVSLNDTQKMEVKNMVNAVTESTLKTLIATQSPLLVGPQGPQGPTGPPGTTLIASGRLINKSGGGENVATRTEGTSPTTSLSFMDTNSAFSSFQHWMLDVNNNLKNRYDNNCLTMDPEKEKVFIQKCEDSPNQKWTWDSSNRLISTTNSTDTMLKCIALSTPESNVLTTNVPGCSGENCLTNTPRRYLITKDCEINNLNENEVWGFA